ncbi:MAG: tetratricopeptide repeat protein [Myxococcota bacterium]
MRGLARAEPGGFGIGWSFVHGMLREAVVRRAREGGREAALHAACAEMLASKGSSPELAGRRARHLVLAGRAEDALRPFLDAVWGLLEAGEIAAADALLAEAEPATAAVGPLDPRRGELWTYQARVAVQVGDGDRAEALAARIIEHAERAGGSKWTRMAGRAMRARARVLNAAGESIEAIAWLRRSQDALERGGDAAGVLTGLVELGKVLMDAGDHAAAAATWRLAAEECERMGDAINLGFCHAGLGNIAMQAGRYDDAASHFEIARGRFGWAGSRVRLVDSLVNAGEIARFRGRLDEAEACYRDARAQAAAAGSWLEIVAELNLGMVLVMRGRHDEARRLLEGCLPRTVRLRRVVLTALNHAALLPCVAAARDWLAWDEHHRALVEVMDGKHVVDADIALAAGLGGDVARAAGKWARARDAWAVARDQWAALGRTEEVERMGRRMGGG